MSRGAQITQVQLVYNRVVMKTTSIQVKLPVFFKAVDVMEHKEGICRKDANAVAVLSVDHVESCAFVWIPVKPLFRACSEEPVTEDSPDVINEGSFGKHYVVIGEAETMKIRCAIGWPDSANHFTSLQRVHIQFFRGGWYVDDVVSVVHTMRYGDVNN